jgi:Calcineurin-like phosphoesterase
MYDLIGDIHGHAEELVQLLMALGYQKHKGVYGYPDRKVIFLGDFIDRGPQIRQVLEIVRPMIEEGKALAIMGNHELNALAYHTEDPDQQGEFLRRHSEKNVHQHRKTVEQLKHDELKSYLAWFRTLPMWLDLNGLRVVHACWDERAIGTIAQGLEGHQGMTDAFLHSACKKGNALFAPVEIVLKGKEASLPTGHSFRDKEGNERTEIRNRWYLPPENHTYRTYALHYDEIRCEDKLHESVIEEAVPYPITAKPVFVGHYWLSAHRPEVLAENVACLDFSVANGGFLCAYRWRGEQKLTNTHFAWVADGKLNGV